MCSYFWNCILYSIECLGLNDVKTVLPVLTSHLPHGLKWLLLAALGPDHQLGITCGFWISKHLTNEWSSTVCWLGTVYTLKAAEALGRKTAPQVDAVCKLSRHSCRGVAGGATSASPQHSPPHSAPQWPGASPNSTYMLSNIFCLFHGVYHTLPWILLIPRYLLPSPLLNCKLLRVGVMLF